jgi:hypothetical protein
VADKAVETSGFKALKTYFDTKSPVSDLALARGAQSLYDCDTPVCRGKRPEDHLGIVAGTKPEGDGRPVKGKLKPKELNYVISR